MAKQEELQNLVTRAPRREVSALKAWARMHGRTLEEELRIAYRLHLHGHRIGHLRQADPDENGLNVEQELETAIRRFDELSANAYTLPSPTEDMLASVGGPSD